MAYSDMTVESMLDEVFRLQEGLVARATGGDFNGGNDAYKRLRRALMERQNIRDKVPDFVRRCHDLEQFWQFIKYKFPHWIDRKEFIWENFRPLVEYLEADASSPGSHSIEAALKSFDRAAIHDVWRKALSRIADDPEGAITAARTLLEMVCKHILDDASRHYPDDADLPKLWMLCSEELNLAPHQHQEKLFKAILGNCQSVVNNIAAIRNKIGDAHGQGRRQVRPKKRHAELVVNLAGTMASFIVATWMERD